MHIPHSISFTLTLVLALTLTSRQLTQRYVAVHDFEPTDENDLSLKEGDVSDNIRDTGRVE